MPTPGGSRKLPDKDRARFPKTIFSDQSSTAWERALPNMSEEDWIGPEQNNLELSASRFQWPCRSVPHPDRNALSRQAANSLFPLRRQPVAHGQQIPPGHRSPATPPFARAGYRLGPPLPSPWHYFQLAGRDRAARTVADRLPA